MFTKSLSTPFAGVLVALAAVTSLVPLAAQEPRIITGLRQPESIAIGPRGQVYVSETGEYEKANDGYISILEAGRTRRFATGLDDPHGIKWWRDHLFVSDNMGMLWRIDAKGNVERFVDATDFPRKITNFNELEIDSAGNIYISAERATMEKIAGGFGAADGLARDARGRLIITDYAGHRVFVLAKPGAQKPGKPQEMEVSGIESAADLVISPDGKNLLIPDMGGGKLATLPMPR